MEEIGTGYLTIYTLGETFTPLIRNFICEGSYYIAYETLKDGGAPAEYIKKFFLFECEFTGDSRTKEGLMISTCKRPADIDINEVFHTGLRTLMATYKRKCKPSDLQDDDDHYDSEFYESHEFLMLANKDKNLKALFKVFTEEEVVDLVFLRYLAAFKFEIANPNDEWVEHGSILQDGTFIKLSYDEHKFLVPFLKRFKKASSSDEFKDVMNFKVSSKQLLGKLQNALNHPSLKDFKPTDAQVQTLFDYRKHLYGKYGQKTAMTGEILNYICQVENYGAKYEHLIFLKRFYPHIPTPNISKEMIEGVKNFVRTSPEYSIAGLLNSKFYTGPETLDEMRTEFEKFKNVISNNKLYLFYQEYIDGSNGVCHMSDEGFTYQVSDKQGAVVNGHKTTDRLTPAAEAKLKAYATELFEDFKHRDEKTPKPNQTIQLEFVSYGDDVVILQLRFIRAKEKTKNVSKPDNVFATGKTFSQGEFTGLMKDVLVVGKDAKSEALIGKKALIVTEDVEFSHILALSIRLDIPSMYSVGEFNLPETAEINFTAINKESWVEVINK